MGSPSADKRKAREQAFIILFERSFNSELTIDEILKIAVESEVIEKNKMTADIVRKAEEHIDEIDGVIEKNLKGWSKQRLSKVSLALLRMAVCEMKYFAGPYAIDKAADADFEQKLETFRAVTKTEKAVHLTLVTSRGLVRNAYANSVQSEVTLDDLFRA